jgi:hypothetical protein
MNAKPNAQIRGPKYISAKTIRRTVMPYFYVWSDGTQKWEPDHLNDK